MSQLTDLVAKVSSARKEQDSIFIDRYDEIAAAWIAVISQQHVFLLGLPGIAKSMIAEDMLRRVTGTRYFSVLIKKETVTTELFGPPSISALKNDRYEFMTDGFLPTAHFVFLDEIWKGNSGLLNSNLRALNEREFVNGNKVEKIPLITAFTASNELPQDESLSALYDRIALRLHVRDLESDGDFKDLLVRRPTLLDNPVSITLDELRLLQAAAKKVTIPEEVLDKIVSLRAVLKAKTGIRVSPRRWLQSLSCIQAHALINGRKEATDEDIAVLQFTTWDTLEERSKAVKEVLTVANPLNAKILELLDQAEDSYKAVRAEHDADGPNKVTVASEHSDKLRRITIELRKIDKESSGETKERATKAVQKVESWHRWVLSETLGINLHFAKSED